MRTHILQSLICIRNSVSHWYDVCSWARKTSCRDKRAAQGLEPITLYYEMKGDVGMSLTAQEL